MTLSEKEIQGIKVISLQGKFDSDYTTTEQTLSSVIKETKKVILDCQNLTYINSYGLRSLLMLVNQMSKRNSLLIFCNLKENIKTVFQITGFIHLFLVYNSRDEAIDAILNSEQ